MDVTFFKSQPYFSTSPLSQSSLPGEPWCEEIPVPPVSLPPVVEKIEDDEPVIVEDKEAVKIYISARTDNKSPGCKSLLSLHYCQLLLWMSVQSQPHLLRVQVILILVLLFLMSQIMMFPLLIEREFGHVLSIYY
ncbi:hypothetical protein CsSME_00033393 [Camellia sinensis var. sinensis]